MDITNVAYQKNIREPSIRVEFADKVNGALLELADHLRATLDELLPGHDLQAREAIPGSMIIIRGKRDGITRARVQDAYDNSAYVHLELNRTLLDPHRTTEDYAERLQQLLTVPAAQSA